MSAATSDTGVPSRAITCRPRSLQSQAAHPRAEVCDVGSELAQAAGWVSHHLVAERQVIRTWTFWVFG